MKRNPKRRGSLNRRYLRNLEKVWLAADEIDRAEGESWYHNANSTCRLYAAAHNLPIEAVAGVVAALSPGRNWEVNIRDMSQMVSAFTRKRAIPTVGSYGRLNRKKALRILRGRSPMWILKGPKVQAFYQGISNPFGRAVCMDRHMKSILEGRVLSDKESSIRPYEYEWLASHVTHLADKFGVLPNVFQAIVWTYWRRNKSELRSEA